MALNEFEGTVMLVSHDRALLRAVCDEFWMVSRGGVEPFDGDLDDYQRYLLDEAKRQREEIREENSRAAKAAAKAAQPVAKPVAAPAKATSKPKNSGAQRELAKVEDRMATLNTQGAALEGRLAASPPPTEIADIGRSLKAVNDELQALEEKWLALSSELEGQSA
jgi:ATP-binding cassette subfamily F protein 3